MRLKRADLQPGVPHAVQVRAIREGQTSEWSERFLFTSDNNLLLPKAPTGVTWVVSDEAFVATWTPVTQDSSNGPAIINSYELEFTASGTTKIISVAPQTGTNLTYTLTLAMNSGLFGTPKPSIDFRVRAVNNKGVKGTWSGVITATNPKPAAPTGFTANGLSDAVELAWTANTETDLAGYNIYVGTPTTFTPAAGNKIFTGDVTRFVYRTTTYSTQFFKIRAVDRFGQESDLPDTVASAAPQSPFVVDTTAPAVPTALAATITNNANGIGARAAVSWTMTTPPSDLAGFYVRYRKVGDTNYSSVAFQKDDRAGTIELQSAYTNYEFQIKAFDWQNNESAWSATVTATSPSNAAPANVTGLVSTPGKDSILYSWSPVADTDIKNYEVTFSTSPTFASGNITYLTGTSTTLTVGGLAPNTAYYARVRAVDNGGLTSAAFSATDTENTGVFPLSDGTAPASSPTPSVAPGLGYLYATWTPVANNDPVTYEVHLSTTTGFTPSGATKVTEVNGAFALIDVLPGTTNPLVYGTTYFVKLIAKDRDGAAAAGAQGSGVPAKLAAGDSALTAGDVGAPTTAAFNTLTGTVNTSIKGYVTEYSVNSSETTAPTTGWSTTTPTRNPGDFIWTRTTVTYNDNSTATTNPALMTGNTGATGSQGIPGTPGADGTSLYTWIKYADTPTTGMADSPTGKTYMGIAYNKTSSTESSTYSDYEWSLIKGADGSTGAQGIPGPPGADGQPTYTWIKYGTSSAGAGLSDDPTGKTYMGIAYNKTTATESTVATDYEWSLIQGPQGVPGTPAATIDLTATAQVLTSPAAGGATTPATSTITGTASNTTITAWTYSVDGGAFSATVPAGVSRTGNVVTITGSTMTARTIAVRMADAGTVADTLTVAKAFDGATGGTGGTGPAGADAYTVLLTNEAKVFPGTTTTAVAGSAATSVIAYKNAVAQNATIGTIPTLPTGMTAAITNNGTTTATVTFTVTTALVQQSGTVAIPITVGGQAFTKNFSWSVSYTGATGNTGNTGATGKGVTSITPYFLQQTTGAAAPATPTASPPTGGWVATEPTYVGGTELWRTERIIYTDATFAYTTPTKVSAYDAATVAIAAANGKNKITHSTGTPGTTANAAGDTWFQYDGSNRLIGQWRGTGGTSWTAETIENALIATLDAAKITTGFLDVTNRIQANAINASKIAVADFNNYAGDGNFLYDNSWSYDAVAVRTADGTNPNYITLTRNATSNRDVYGVNYFDVQDNDTYYVTYEVWRESTNPSTATASAETVRIGINAITPANTHTWQGATTTSAQLDANATDTWFAASGIITIPAGYVRGRPWLSAQGATASNNKYRIRKVRIFKRGGGELIIDGTIQANKITAGTYTGGNFIVGAGGAIQASNYSAGATGWRISNTGVEMNDSGSSVKADAIKAGTLGGLSGSGLIDIAAGTSLRFSGGHLRSNTYTYPGQTGSTYIYNAGATAGFYLGNDGLVIAQGTIKAEAFAGGTFTAGNIVMGAGGSISGGLGLNTWTLSNSGLSIPNAGIQAASLNLQVGQNLIHPKWADFEANNYPASATWPANSNSGLAVTIDTSSAYTNTQSLRVANTSGASRTVYFGDSITDYHTPVRPANYYIVSAYISNVGGAAVTGQLMMKLSDGSGQAGATQTFANTTTWTRYTFVMIATPGVTGALPGITLTANGTVLVDAVQVEQAINPYVSTASAYAPPGSTRIDGGIIRTGSIISNVSATKYDYNTNAYVTDATKPAWSINLAGNASFNNAQVLGNLVVGDPAEVPTALTDGTEVLTGPVSSAASGNYRPGAQGWMLRSDGYVEFRNVVAKSLHGKAVIADTLSVNTLKSNSDLNQTIWVRGELTAKNDVPGAPGEGSSVSLSGKGFFVKGPTIEGNPDYIVFPTSGAPNIISGTLQASTLNVNGLPDPATGELRGASFRGINHFELSSEVMLDNATGSPIAAPSVVEDVPATFLYNSQGPSQAIRGLVKYNGFFWRAEFEPVLDSSVNYIHKFNATSGIWVSQTVAANPAPVGGGSAVDAKILGIAHIGTNWFAFWYLPNATTNKYYLAKYSDDWTTMVSSTNITVFGGAWSWALGDDGTNLILASWDPRVVTETAGTGTPIIRHYSPTTLATTGTDVVCDSGISDDSSWNELGAVLAGEFDYGTGNKTYIIVYNYTNSVGDDTSAIYAYNSSGVYQNARIWGIENPGSWTRGMCWEPGQGFWQVNFSNQLYRYTLNMWDNSVPSTIGWSYSWYKASGRTQSVTTNATNTIVGPAGAFFSTDNGADISGTGLTAGTKITSVVNTPTASTITISPVAPGSATFNATIAYETAPSPLNTFVAKKRRRYSVTGAAGQAGTVLRFYLSRGLPPVVGTSWLQTTAASNITSINTEALSFSGASIKSPGTFAVGTPSKIYSQQTYTYTVTPVTTNGTITINGTGSAPVFGQHMVGAVITGTNIPTGTKIIAVSDDRIFATLSQAATGTSTSNLTMTLVSPSFEVRGDGFVNFERLYSRQTILTSTQDVNANSGNMPPLRIGDINGAHQRMDGNEIQAMANDNTVGNLFINQSGGTVKLGQRSQAFTGIDMGERTDTTNANGDITVPHNLASTPTLIMVNGRGDQGTANLYMPHSANSTSFLVRVRASSTGTALGAGVSRTLDWIAVAI